MPNERSKASVPEMLTLNFSRAELACKCGCGLIPKPEFLKALQLLREKWGKSMKVTSAARCQNHNMKVGGAPASKHVQGIAVDIYLPNSQDRYDFVKLCMELDFKGIGISDKGKFIHVDDRDEGRAIWEY